MFLIYRETSKLLLNERLGRISGLFLLKFLFLFSMKNRILFVLFLQSFFFFGQNIETNFVSKFSLKADKFIGIDDFQNVYFILNNVFYKKNKNQTISYNNPNLGILTSVNIQNPFKIYLFYKEFNSLVILDNNLNELSGFINFTTETLFNNVIFISNSSENNIWLYADDNKLHLYNFQNRSEKIQTQPITFYQNDFEPINIKSSYKNVWVISKTGVIQFNEYGNFIQVIEMDNISYLFPYRKGFIFYKEKSLFFYDGNSTIEITINFEGKIKEIYSNNSSIYFYEGENVYQFNYVTVK